MSLRQAYGDGFAGRLNRASPSALYLRGDEFTDGSLRLIPSERGTSGKFDLQCRQRTDGVWNSTGIKVSGASVRIADELIIAGAGEWIRTIESSGDESLLPNVEFEDLAGTGRTRSPVVNNKIIRVVVQPDDTSEVVGTFLESSFTATSSALASRVYHKVGSVGATEPILYVLRRDSSTGNIFFEQTLPVSLMSTPGAEFEIELPGMTETNPGDVFFGQMSSDANISVKSDSNGFWFFAADAHPFGREEILLENLAIKNDAGLVLVNDGSFVTVTFPSFVAAELFTF